MTSLDPVPPGQDILQTWTRTALPAVAIVEPGDHALPANDSGQSGGDVVERLQSLDVELTTMCIRSPGSKGPARIAGPSSTDCGIKGNQNYPVQTTVDLQRSFSVLGRRAKAYETSTFTDHQSWQRLALKRAPAPSPEMSRTFRETLSPGDERDPDRRCRGRRGWSGRAVRESV